MATATAIACVLPLNTTRAEAASTDRCAALKGRQIQGATVTDAGVNTTGTFVVPEGQGGPGEGKPGDPYDSLPAFCAVELADSASAAHYTVWLPADSWNGRFEGVGGGGFVAGFSYRELSEAIRSGYAVAATDSGHPASDAYGQFALDAAGHLNQRAIDDFAYRAVHRMTVVGKDVVSAYYGHTAQHAYFNGCSTGGRQALTEAQRYPQDYNGIVAGSPAVDFASMAPGQLWPVFVQQRSGNHLPTCKLKAFYDASMAACDRLDGVTDGLVGDVDDCHFDPRRLIGRSTPCGVITRADAAVVQEILDGPGPWYGLEPASDFHYLAGYPLYIAVNWYKYWLARDPGFDWTTMTTAQYLRLYRDGEKEFSELQGDDPDLTSFRDAGGKLLMWTGLADPLIPPQGAIRYYDDVVRTMHGQDRTAAFARLFLAPGVGHCGGPAGTVGPTPVDPLAAVTGWVENGVAPATIAAAQTLDDGTVRTRPLCAYPSAARYDGHGSTDSANNFYCTPARPTTGAARAGTRS